MGERKGTNKYYPPDFDPAKHFSLAGYHGQHPLRERARKLKTQGILVIRFEMPYNIWCDGCNSHVGMGVRYNAEKSKIGMYYSTPIWKFRMKCALCDNHYEMKTDPANQDYVIISGARRKEQRWDPIENEQVVPEDRETHKKLETDPMYKLEHGLDDKTKIGAAVPTLAKIEQIQSQWKDDFKINQLAREKFRKEKKALAVSKQSDDKLLEKASLDIKLVPEDKRDVKLAGLLRYGSVVFQGDTLQDAKKAMESARWFDKPGNVVSDSPCTSSSVGSAAKKSIQLSRLQDKIKNDKRDIVMSRFADSATTSLSGVIVKSKYKTSENLTTSISSSGENDCGNKLADNSSRCGMDLSLCSYSDSDGSTA